jgi:hypothetical protein
LKNINLKTYKLKLEALVGISKMRILSNFILSVRFYIGVGSVFSFYIAETYAWEAKGYPILAAAIVGMASAIPLIFWVCILEEDETR